MGFGGLGGPEIIIILAIALIVLGPKRLPEVGRSVGRGMREFKEAVTHGDHDDDVDELDEHATSRRTD
jgi:sec-independent protein translocase protein TatA